MGIEHLKGKLITFEGVDGAGKTTQINILSEYLTSQGINNIVTRQPGGTKIGQQIRKSILSVENAEMSDLAELLLYAADRAQHCQEIILPELQKGTVVLCDRYVDSAVAYQGYGRKLDLKTIQNLNNISTQGVEIFKTIFLDILPIQAFARISDKKHDRLEQAGVEFFDNVYKGFCELCNKNATRICRIDAQRDIVDVHVDILNHILNNDDYDFAKNMVNHFEDKNKTSKKATKSTKTSKVDNEAQMSLIF